MAEGGVGSGGGAGPAGGSGAGGAGPAGGAGGAGPATGGAGGEAITCICCDQARMGFSRFCTAHKAKFERMFSEARRAIPGDWNEDVFEEWIRGLDEDEVCAAWIADFEEHEAEGAPTG